MGRVPKDLFGKRAPAERLGQKRPEQRGLAESIFCRVDHVAADHDERQRGILLRCLTDEFKPVEFRHAVVGDHHGGSEARERGEGGTRAREGMHGTAQILPQHEREEIKQRLFVVDQDDGWRRRDHTWGGAKA